MPLNDEFTIMSATPQFEFHLSADATLDDRLVLGSATPGMSSLIAVNHLIEHQETTKVGHARAHNLPAITPFSDGVPRQPIRLYATENGPNYLVSEVFHPAGIAELFADALWELATDHGVEEITQLYGVPYPHGPEDHAVFYVGTEPPATERLGEIQPLTGGFLDGIPGRLLERGLEADQPAAQVFVTPAHLPGPEFEAAIRLVNAIGSCFDVAVDTTELQEESAEIKRYYQELTDRLNDQEDETDILTDRMYM